MIQAVILVCAYGIDPMMCTEDNALSRFSTRVNSQLECMRASEMLMAPTAISPIFGREYEKVICETKEATR